MRPYDEHDKGWECPRCERIWSPQVVQCGTCALERQVRLAARAVRNVPNCTWDQLPGWQI